MKKVATKMSKSSTVFIGWLNILECYEKVVTKMSKSIDHFTVVYSVTWPLNGSEAGGDLALIQTSLVLSCKIN